MGDEAEAFRETHDDQELMAAFYACSESAFETLASRWWERLFTFFRNFGESPSNAEDMAQDTLVRLYQTKQKRSYDVRRPFTPFLFTIARNRWVEELRKRARSPSELSLDPVHDRIQAPECAARDALCDDLLQCIWKLTPSQQTYILLCGKHGLGQLSHLEIAEVLEKWPAQITKISQCARKHLRECLSAKGYQ
jgi:RNA polymerase sigma-70 factor (ECF subfamily)